MRTIFSVFLTAALLLSLCACGVPVPESGGEESAPAYPSAVPYPDETAYLKPNGELKDEFYDAWTAWSEEGRARRELGAGSAQGLEGCFAALLRQYLTAPDGRNKILSPLNLYIALAMLAEVTGADSRDEILALLGEEDIAAVREKAGTLWRANYQDDGATAVLPAASFWLRDDTEYVPETLDLLAREYFASAHRGKMGSDELNAALQSWLNEETGGLLKEAAGGIATTPETVLALCATLYFRARWSDEFSENVTAPDVFHAPDEDRTCEFMHQNGPRSYYWGECFSAVAQRLESGGAMWFLLPDEGVTPEDLLADEEAMAFLLAPGESGEKSKFLVVNLSVPKFDVNSDLDLRAGLRSLGLVEVFDPDEADFSPLAKDPKGIFLSDAKHAARVVIDEKGCVAAAYTVMMAAGAAMPPEEKVDFTLDRPFLFLITGEDNVPLFAGVVNEPA